MSRTASEESRVGFGVGCQAGGPEQSQRCVGTVGEVDRQGMPGTLGFLEGQGPFQQTRHLMLQLLGQHEPAVAACGFAMDFDDTIEASLLRQALTRETIVTVRGCMAIGQTIGASQLQLSLGIFGLQAHVLQELTLGGEPLRIIEPGASTMQTGLGQTLRS